MLEEGPGYLICVEGPTRTSVVHDHPLTTLSGDLGTLITPGVVGGRKPVVHIPSLEPRLQLPGSKVFISIGGNGLWDTPPCKILPQNSDNVGGCVLR